jgi:hypothetical protein
MMTKLPNIRSLHRAVANFDDSILDLDGLNGIAANLATEEELKMIQEYQGELPLDKAEVFLKELHEIPQLAQRVGSWLYLKKFDETLVDLAMPLETYFAAISALRESKSLRLVLGAVLGLGNFMNAGTPRGAASAFALASLSQLGGVKDTRQGRISLLMEVVRLLRSIQPDIAEALPQELSSLAAITQTIAATRESISVAQKTLDQAVQVAESVLMSLEEHAEFAERVAPRLRQADRDLYRLMKRAAKAQRHFERLLLYFGYRKTDTAIVNPVDFFQDLTAFVTLWKQASHDLAEVEKKDAAEPRRRKQGRKVEGDGTDFRSALKTSEASRPEQQKRSRALTKSKQERKNFLGSSRQLRVSDQVARGPEALRTSGESLFGRARRTSVETPLPAFRGGEPEVPQSSPKKSDSGLKKSDLQAKLKAIRRNTIRKDLSTE